MNNEWRRKKTIIKKNEIEGKYILHYKMCVRFYLRVNALRTHWNEWTGRWSIYLFVQIGSAAAIDVVALATKHQQIPTKTTHSPASGKTLIWLHCTGWTQHSRVAAKQRTYQSRFIRRNVWNLLKKKKRKICGFVKWRMNVSSVSPACASYREKKWIIFLCGRKCVYLSAILFFRLFGGESA